ncbi:unnamed protein product [Prorocentrum cordatum]|uniref:Uncharacterized protein n=1 Tax=Prorocentrum cordatum TaxID=2364126 RepID=A0ABN9WTU4_9DINO|nr:unnamed protein product [Polarella glacialis]CAK0889579.1 unnamed protein product [Polarella glacialis]
MSWLSHSFSSISSLDNLLHPSSLAINGSRVCGAHQVPLQFPEHGVGKRKIKQFIGGEHCGERASTGQDAQMRPAKTWSCRQSCSSRSAGCTAQQINILARSPCRTILATICVVGISGMLSSGCATSSSARAACSDHPAGLQVSFA